MLHLSWLATLREQGAVRPQGVCVHSRGHGCAVARAPTSALGVQVPNIILLDLREGWEEGFT